MSVRRDGEIVHLEGDCHIEQAETLAALLDAQPQLTVDLSQCRHAHSAVIQVLLQFKPALQGMPDSYFLRTLILPALRDGGGKS